MRTIQNKEELSQDLRELLDDIGGSTISRVNTSLSSKVGYGRITRPISDEKKLIPDERLEYVLTLIKEAFVFRSMVIPFSPPMICKEDLENSVVWNRLIELLDKELLHRLDQIPRGNFTHKEIADILHPNNWLYGDDCDKVDVDKMYVLTLFIYDYVQVSFNEMKLNPFIDETHDTVVHIDGDTFRSNKRIDAMLLEYISKPYTFEHDAVSNNWLQTFRDSRLYDPDRKIEKHPKSSVKNMTAMFCDLFSKFLPTLNLIKRSDAGLSDMEKSLVAQLAKACGICGTDKVQSVFPMYYQHKNYFLDCNLHLYIRDNEYGCLLLNNNEDLLFMPEVQ